MIFLNNRLPLASKVTPGSVNASLGEIQAIFNRIGVLRGIQSDPQSDYFVFDNDSGKLYLMTIEGDQHEVLLG